MSTDINNMAKGREIKEISIFNIRINPLTISEFLAIIESGIREGRHIAQFGVNSATINDVVRSDEFRNILNSVELIHIDGMSVVWALRSFGFHIPERVATPDLADDLLVLADREKLKVFLFGAQEEILIRCRQNIEKKYPGLVIAGCRNGFYSPGEEEEILDLINTARPDIILLGMSSPRKEQFYYKYRHNLNAGYILGVGGYFDIMAGTIKRAPLWMQNAGLEWLFRLIQEPKRLWKRYFIGIFQFFWLVIREKLRRVLKSK